MKRFWAVGALILTVAVAVAIFVIPALAAPSRGATSQTDGRSGQAAARLFSMEHQQGTAVNGAAQLDGDPYAYSCAGYGATDSNLVVEVTEAIVNDADSGQAGNYWAFDNVNRSITIWNVGPGQYCILVNYYKSTFHAIAGQTSPGMGGILSGEEYGSFKGAALFTVSGQFAASDPSAWPTEGRVNGGVPVDYQCDANGNCPGYVSFLGKYFNTGDPSFNYAEPQWGWTYVGLDSGSATKHPTSTGTWINAYTGNSGDILDVD